MSYRIMCIDMDAFYVSVEQSFKPYLKHRPLAVGGKRDRGVICTCSYEARKYGIHSGMGSAVAKSLCPELVFLPVDIQKYSIVSKNIFSLLSKMLPKLVVSSIDEAYADITDIKMDTFQLIKKIKYVIKKYFDITCTIGVGPNKMTAKMATTVNKPDGYYIVDDDSAVSFLDSFPLSKIWGIGASTLNRLSEYGIFSVYELRTYGKENLENILGIHGKKLYNAVNGIYEEDEAVKLSNKSISKATTFEYDISSKQELYSYMYLLSEKVSRKLMDNLYAAKVISLTLKTYDFEYKTYRKTQNKYFFTHDDIYNYAKQLFDEHNAGKVPLRLIGVGVAGLQQVDDSFYLYFTDKS